MFPVLDGQLLYAASSLLKNSGRSILERRYCDFEAGEADVEQKSGSAFFVPSPTKKVQ
jgi:hypothetical protein